jgi:two-component system, NarL family, nitrate/nitrite response regulator NarL
MSTSKHFRVAVVDRHQLFVDCLGVVLEMRKCDLQKVALPPGCARTRQVLASVLATRPAAAVVNADLGPQCSAPELIGGLAGSGVAVVVIADESDEALWGQCLASGARIVIPRSACLATMVSVIGRLSRGERVLEVSERERLLTVYRQRTAHRRECLERLSLLSANEGEILLHLVEGHNVREIALHRVVSEATVRTQVKSILSKLEVSSQLSAVAVAHVAGWDRAALAAVG